MSIVIAFTLQDGRMCRGCPCQADDGDQIVCNLGFYGRRTIDEDGEDVPDDDAHAVGAYRNKISGAIVGVGYTEGKPQSFLREHDYVGVMRPQACVDKYGE